MAAKLSDLFIGVKRSFKERSRTKASSSANSKTRRSCFPVLHVFEGNLAGAGAGVDLLEAVVRAGLRGLESRRFIFAAFHVLPKKHNGEMNIPISSVSFCAVRGAYCSRYYRDPCCNLITCGGVDACSC